MILSVILHATFLGCRAQLNKFRFKYPEDANYQSFILPTGEGKIDRTKGKWVASIPVGNKAPSGLMSVFKNSDRKVVGEMEYKDLPPSVVMPSDGTFKLTLQEGEVFEGEWQQTSNDTRNDYLSTD